LASAAKKLAAAKKTLAIDEEASYQLAYEAMLKASLGFMHFLYSAHPGGPPAGRAFIPATEMLHFSKR